jgi:hypothetical protein
MRLGEDSSVIWSLCGHYGVYLHTPLVTTQTAFRLFAHLVERYNTKHPVSNKFGLRPADAAQGSSSL